MTGTIQRAVRTGPSTAADGFVAVTVNGAERQLSAHSSVAALLTSLSLDPRAVVVEHNGTILRDRESLPSIALDDGDVVEIVHFVGGG
jgi:thiamine biosynthesis protein ThiS